MKVVLITTTSRKSKNLIKKFIKIVEGEKMLSNDYISRTKLQNLNH